MNPQNPLQPPDQELRMNLMTRLPASWKGDVPLPEGMRLAAYDRDGSLAGTWVRSGPAESLLRQGHQLYLINEQEGETRFAALELITCRVEQPPTAQFRPGIHGRMRLRASIVADMYRLVEASPETQTISFAKAYRIMQPQMQSALRNFAPEFARERGLETLEDWSQCLTDFAASAKRTIMATALQYGLVLGTPFTIEGIAWPPMTL